MSRRFLVVIAALSAAFFGVTGATGCQHVTTKVPGVLDLRSDASELPAETKAIKSGPREGFDSFMWGSGVQNAGSNVTVEDRKYWVLGLIPVFNDSATEEIQAAVGDGALRQVTIGEQLSIWNILTTVALGAFPVPLCTFGVSNVVDFFLMPPLDFKMSGVRATVQPGSAAPALPAAPVGPTPVPSGSTSDIPPLAPGEE